MSRVELGAVVQIVSEEMARRWGNWRISVSQDQGRIDIRAEVEVFFHLADQTLRLTNDHTWDLETIARASHPRVAVAIPIDRMAAELFDRIETLDAQ